MAITKAVEAITDWTAVAQNTVVQSATLDCSGHYGTILNIQAFLDTTTAHAAGTDFIVQVSSTTSGNEDWQDYTIFNALGGTAVKDDVENNPLNATETSITLTGHALTALGKWIAIEDATLVDSELFFEVSQSTNAIVALEGVTNTHQNTADIYNIAISQVILLDASVYRVRVLVNNTIVATGSTLNYKLRATKITAI